MAIEMQIDEQAGVAVLKVGHPISRDDACAAVDELLAEPRLRPATKAIAVLAKGALSCLTPTDMRVVAYHTIARTENAGLGVRLALVVSTDADFQVACMYAAWLECLGRRVRVFWSLADAHDWVSAVAAGPASGLRSSPRSGLQASGARPPPSAAGTRRR
jgi:hypothetical protein